MAMLVGGNGIIRAEMNVTPMIDVLLVLIIIFMVVMPVTYGFKAAAPSPSTDDAHAIAPDDDIILSVLSDGTLQLNQEPLALADLAERLKLVFKNHLNHVIFIQGQKDVDFEQIAQVIDVARGVGLDRVALMPYVQ